MKITTISIFMSDLAIAWDDQTSGVISLKKLRKLCPCAFCSGEKDVFGNVYKGKRALSENSYLLLRFEKVGLYGIRLFWADGHHDGIYTYEMLKSLTENEN